MSTEDELVMNLITNFSLQTKVFIFSGVIRNFFLGEKNNRDIDIILENEIDLSQLVQNAEIRQNSFGGYKIIYRNTTIDLWYLENTWAFKNQQELSWNFYLERKVPGTAFFNFSSIVFSFNEKVFYYTNHFLKFLQNEKIDVVNKKNPNYKLCVVNTFYYSDKYNLNISKGLKDYIVELHNKNDGNYLETQIKHFGKEIYSNGLINFRINNVFKERKKRKNNLKLDQWITQYTEERIGNTLKR